MNSEFNAFFGIDSMALSIDGNPKITIRDTFYVRNTLDKVHVCAEHKGNNVESMMTFITKK